MATAVTAPVPVPTPAIAQPVTAVVPVSSPAHPSHAVWLDILTKILGAAIAIGPAVVAVVDPKDAALAAKLGAIATGAEASLTPGA